MTRRSRAGVPLVVSLVLALGGLAGCGVGVDDASPVAALSSPASPGPSVTATSDSPVVYLARGDELVRSRRPLPPRAGVKEILAALAVPVTAGEARRGLRSVVGSADPKHPLFLTPDDAPSPAPTTGATRVVATDALRSLPPAQQLLAIAQVTLSLASLGNESVAFVDQDGTVLAVPAPGGRTLDRPVTAADYASLRAG